jgi:hypothetical protein
MRRHSRLHLLDHSSSKHLDRLSRRALTLRLRVPSCSPWEIEVESSAIVMDLQNTWANTCKWYMVSCLLGAYTAQGVRVSCPARPIIVDDAIRMAIRLYKPKSKVGPGQSWRPFDEPPWHIPDAMLVVSGKAQLNNHQDLAKYLSTGFYVFSDLPIYRNYFAHRNKDTKDRATNLAPRYGKSVADKPSLVLLSVPSNRPVSVLEDWIREVRLTVNAICA